ncbi:hypothetical protein AN963_14710 [Brevibacillus choshinensis]|uniref:DUF4825 domain-containing protein n=1 Tax=Brevibacillus choshinensis TaxID=54911 RepID=A0ABR5N6G5_BRECH|nr:DUF4825 domain-containing protein [Brevibacillus choshinensis]KQL46220.1 hypothetical protein AN963_14710 [Brevibacillus choshinensis]
MAARNKWIMALVIVGVILFALIQGVIIPDNIKKAEQYRLDQQNPLTHDLNAILPYKSKYMGDASNLSNLYAHLPLNGVKKTFQLYPEALTLELNYEETVSEVGEESVKAALLYDSVAAFALIDNLQAIRYRFPDATYQMTRLDMQQLFGENLSGLLNQEKWKTDVQDRLKEWTKESPRFKQ